MADSLSTSLEIYINTTQTDATGTFLTSREKRIKIAMANGTASGQADVPYAKRRTITNNATPDTIDLSGTLVGNNGDTIVFVEVTTIIVLNQSTAQILTVGAGSNPFATWLAGTTPSLKVGKAVTAETHPGVIVIHNGADGFVVTAATGDILQIATDGGTNVLYDIFIIGRSA